MIERTELCDIWQYDSWDTFRCITTNGVVNKNNNKLVMGKGIALEAKERYPNLPEKLGKYVLQYGNRPFICFDEYIISFPTKHHYSQNSDIQLITFSANKIVEIVNKFNIKRVLLTRPGCGNGNLKWDEVKSIISKIFDDRFTVLQQYIDYKIK